MAGRPALPDELHALKGTASKAANVIPMALTGGRPKCPRHLSKAARREWLALVKLLEARGVLDPGAGPTLELYATTKVRWLEAKADVDKRGIQIMVTKTTARGELYEAEIQNPMLAVEQDSAAMIKDLTKSLGLDPSARERVKKVRSVSRSGSPAWYVPPKGNDNV
jgi:P27 family predicted phage terminase small subunit